jgi:DHA1 family purine base/nucleoside efflux pump-like MFS transporter
VTDSKDFHWKVALILFGVLFLGVSDTQLVPLLLSPIAAEFQTTPGHTGIIVASYSLAAAVFALFAGPLSDRIGRRTVLLGGLVLFALSSFSTYHVSNLNALVIVRTLTGFAAGTLSTCSLSFAGDYYSYAHRGRAMGIISMAYFLAFVVGVGPGSIAVKYWGWRSVFAGLSILSVMILAIVLIALPQDGRRSAARFSVASLASHFGKSDRLAGIAAAFFTSGGLVGFLTYFAAWLQTGKGIGIEKVGLLIMASGIAAAAASPLSGWLSDHVGKREVIIGANLVLAAIFLAVVRLDWNWSLWLAIAVLSICASARQAPLHAITTEIVGSEIRGEYTAVRNAASQLGIAMAATVSAFAFDRYGFSSVSYLAAGMTLLIPLCFFWLRE